MEQRSNPDRIEHLSQQLKKKRNALEDAVFSEVNKASRLVERAYSAYPEWAVRSAAQKVDVRIGEIRKQMNDILKLTDTQSRELLEVSGEYRRVEREMAKKAKLAMQPLRFFPAVVKRDLPSLLLTAVGAWKAAEPEGIAGFRERIKYRVKNAREFLGSVFDRLLTAKVSFVKEDPIVAELLGKLKNGSAEEQTEARKLLMEAAKALQDIAESQQAYDVYAVYGNTAYMEEEQQRAEEAREKLRQLGISESYYGADTDLTVLLGDKDPLKSVQYNPLMNDHSPMPQDEELLALIRNGFEGIIPNMTLEGMQASYAVLEEQIKERERQAIIDAYIKSMLPPTHLPDGTPITADNKVNETTYAYFEEHVLYKHEDYMYVNVPYTAYDAWVKETYGRTGWEEAVHLSDIFIRSLGEELITGVIDLGSTVVEFVIDPVKVTKEAMESAKQTASTIKYFIDNPDKIVEVAQQIYADFDTMSPEEKADILGALASNLIPGAAVTKVSKVDNVVDGINNLSKRVDVDNDVSLTSNGDPGGSSDDDMREQILANIAASQLARDASNFDDYLEIEKRLLSDLEQRKELVGTGSSALYLKNIDEFLSGNKTFDEVLNDYAKQYVEIINTKGWSWEKSITGGDSLTAKQRKLIKSKAEELNLIPKIEVVNVEGMRYGFADFEGAGVVVHTDELPQDLWKKGDIEQFEWLNNNLPEDIKKLVENGTYTWHHTEVPGKMQLVPYGIHNITTHNGGRSTGMWADAAR